MENLKCPFRVIKTINVNASQDLNSTTTSIHTSKTTQEEFQDCLGLDCQAFNRYNSTCLRIKYNEQLQSS